MYLYSEIEKIQPSKNRTEILADAISHALNKQIFWEKHLINIPNYKAAEDEPAPPAFFQLRVETEEYSLICEQIKTQLHMERNSPAPFVIKLLLTAYLLHLKSLPTTEEQAEEEKKRKQEEIKEQLAYFKRFFPEDQNLLIYEKLLNIENEIKELKK